MQVIPKFLDDGVTYLGGAPPLMALARQFGFGAPAPKPAAKPAPAKQPTSAELAKPYIAEFGRESGSVYFARGLAIDEARREHSKEIAQRKAKERAGNREASKPYIETFGLEDGAVYFARGLSFDQARAEHDRTALSRLNAGLARRLAGRRAGTIPDPLRPEHDSIRLPRLNAAVKKQFVDGIGGQ